MSANKWTKKEIWSWYLSEKVEKYKLGRKKSDKADDKYNIRLRAVINGDRLIIGLWQGCKGDRLGVYYITAGASSVVTTDGLDWHNGKLEYIPIGGYQYWGYTYNYNFRCISGNDEAMYWLKDKFGDRVGKFCNYDLDDYIGAVEATVSRHRRIAGIKRKRERINNWLEDLPPYPADLLDFCDNTVFGGLHYAFEFERNGAKMYRCSVCAKDFNSSEMKHGKYYDCPLCGAKLRCDKRAIEHHLSSRITLIQQYRDMSGTPYPIKREMFVHKRFIGNGEAVHIQEGSLAVLTGHRYLNNGKEIFFYDSGEWSDKNTWMFQHQKSYCYPDVSALAGTAYDIRSVEAAARAGWFLNFNKLLQYFDEPRMEYLVKGGFYGIVKDLTTDCSTAHLMPGSDIKTVLGLDGQGVARLRQLNGGVVHLAWLRAAFMCGYKLSDRVLNYLAKHSVLTHEAATMLNSGASPEKVVNYIEKQRRLSRSSVRDIVITWRDVINMSGKFQLNGGSYTLFPKDLKKRHRELCGIRDIEQHKSEMKARLDNIDHHVRGIAGEIRDIEKRYPNVGAALDRVRNVFEWSDGEHSVIVPKGVQDILVEGYLLGHCIARPKSDGTYLYFERVEDNETFICFLRKNDALDSPWYTMEVEPDGAIRQLRTFGDDDGEGVDRDVAKAFLKKWRAKVRGRLGKSDVMAAAVSREKRLAEFEELRRGGNIIRTGKLAGRLLVEVLEADFKEYNEETA